MNQNEKFKILRKCNYNYELIEKVKCIHNGEIAYCNSLSCMGTCMSKDILCKNVTEIILK